MKSRCGKKVDSIYFLFFIHFIIYKSFSRLVYGMFLSWNFSMTVEMKNFPSSVQLIFIKSSDFVTDINANF